MVYKPSGENSVPVSISPDVVSQLLNLLQSLGVSQQVMGDIRSKTSQASQKATVVPARTRWVAELEEKWLKSASHLENFREQTTRKEQDYLASMSRFEEHEKLVLKLEAEYREAKNLLVTPVPSVHSDGGEKEGSDGGVVSDTEIQNVEDDDELHDLDLISGLGSDRGAHGGKDFVSSEDGWKVVKRKVRKSSNFEIVFSSRSFWVPFQRKVFGYSAVQS